MNLIDKTLNYFFPDKGLKREEKRSQTEVINALAKSVIRLLDEEKQFSNSGYSNGGASRTKPWVKGWHSHSRSAKSDIEMNRRTLRERTRDLAMNTAVGAAAVGSCRTNCVGQGLMPKPKIDYEFLGLTREQAQEMEKDIRKEFRIWAESTLCDNNDQNNFYELQQIAFSDWLKNGEEFCLIRYDEEQPYMPYQLRLKLVEADRVSTPNSFNADYTGIDKKEKDNTIMNGVEINKEGKVVAYHISSHFPGEYAPQQKWQRVEKRGKNTGNPNILHIFNSERADQYRGVPFLAPVIETIKQMSRYTEAEIMSAIVNSFFAVFVTTKDGAEVEEFGGVDGEPVEEEEDLVSGMNDTPDKIQQQEMELGSGSVHYLADGESVTPVSANHPASSFEGFMNALMKQIGAALEIAPEVLFKSFNKSFSASKAAMNESWKSFRTRRSWFVNDFCQEVYNLWFAEAVSKGRINAPGFFHDIRIRQAYTNCTWSGPTQGQIDPNKEVAAAAARVKEGFSTREDECAAMNGSNFEDNIRTLVNENKMLNEAQNALEREDKENEED